MCLTVQTVPANRETRLILRGYKELYTGMTGELTTPFRGFIVPSSGWLLPRTQDKYGVYSGKNVGRGFVHFFTNNTSRYSASCDRFNCYAFCVEAFNDKNYDGTKRLHTTAVARAIYIKLPHHDDSTVKAIEKFMDGEVAKKGTRVSSLIKSFPRLKAIEEYLKLTPA